MRIRRFLSLPVWDVALHAAAVVAAFGARLHAWWLTAFPNDSELTIGHWCGMCDTVHSDDYQCPRELVRWCLDCTAWVSANRFYRCPFGGTHSLHPDLRRDPFWDRSVELEPLIEQTILRRHLEFNDRIRRRKERSLRVVPKG